MLDQRANLRCRNRNIREFDKKNSRAAAMPIALPFEIITKEFFYGNAGTFKRIVFFASRPRRDDKITQRKDVRKILPCADLAKGVQPDDKVEQVARSFARGKGANGVN